MCPGPLPDESLDDRGELRILAQVPAKRSYVFLQSIEAVRVDIDDIPEQTRKVVMQPHVVSLA
ncbi:hypothetical protein Ahu01nite_033760 [Winogradskya humida]|uniref:Uncharacterized protein n=1 Tax=Winogradskya humida TaxID=113566 RepID=A0ABQ3ZNX2_9ACTN|nr:hypothetical protein Ahu01nite_033760 [Actinoplanes humidus]